MRLQNFIDLTGSIPYHRSGEEHAAGFSSDESCSDHMAADQEIILGSEMTDYHLPHLLIPAHHDITHGRAHVLHIHMVFKHDSCSIKKPVPGVDILFLPRPLKGPKDLVETTGVHPIQNRAEKPVLFVVDMGKEHGFRITVPYLYRTNINRPTVRINIQKELSGIQNLVNGMERMLSPYNGEKGHRVKNKQEGTGNPEEIPHHQVRCPGSL